MLAVFIVARGASPERRAGRGGGRILGRHEQARRALFVAMKPRGEYGAIDAVGLFLRE